MQVTVEMVSTLGGTSFPLDQRIADALMNYAQQAADADGVPRQTWVRRFWKMADYEAKDILKGKASKAHYERILKLKGPHCGWHAGLVVTGAVIGQPIYEFFRETNERAAREASHALEHERLARAAYRRLAAHTDGDGDGGDDPPAAGETRRSYRAVGASPARRLD